MPTEDKDFKLRQSYKGGFTYKNKDDNEPYIYLWCRVGKHDKCPYFNSIGLTLCNCECHNGN